MYPPQPVAKKYYLRSVTYDTLDWLSLILTPNGYIGICHYQTSNGFSLNCRLEVLFSQDETFWTSVFFYPQILYVLHRVRNVRNRFAIHDRGAKWFELI